jgi:hypothetical protein
VKENQVCSKREPGPLRKEDNHKDVKIEWVHLKLFSRTTGPIV